MAHTIICAIVLLLSSCHGHHTATTPKTTPKLTDTYTVKARIIIDQALADQVGDVWAAAERWNQDLGCKVFSLDPGDPTRGFLYVVSMRPWDRNGVLADALWHPAPNPPYGVVRVFDHLHRPLQRHIYRHELGHILGLPNLDDPKDFGDLMFGVAQQGTPGHYTDSYTEATTVAAKVMARLQKQHCGKVQNGDQKEARGHRRPGKNPHRTPRRWPWPKLW